jgi:glc operon protein GlcG
MPDTDVVAMNALSLTAALRVAEAAINSARAKSVAACIAVCDPSSAPIVTIRMDGSARLCADIALNKAYTVSSFNGMPTHDWWAVLADDPALVHGFTQTPRLTIFPGGVAVRIGGNVVGSVGVSGGSSQQDREIAEAGAAAVGGSS